MGSTVSFSPGRMALIRRFMFPRRHGALVKGNRLRELHALAVCFPLSTVDYCLNRKLFDEVRTFVLFIGYPRSGHSLVGAMLNAHAEALIANELNALPYFMLGFRRPQILSMLRRRDEWFAAHGWQWREFDYAVPGASQGHYGTLKVVGDSRAGGVTWHLARQPDLLQRVVEPHMGMDLRIIHNVRNPYDNIATVAVKEGRSLEQAITRYRTMTEIVQAALARLDREQFRRLWHEDMVADVQTVMASLCGFLGLEADDAYLAACKGVIYSQPRQSRDAVRWSDEDVEAVEALCRDFDFLARYRGTVIGKKS